MKKNKELKEVVDQAIAQQKVPHVQLTKMGPNSVNIDKLTKDNIEMEIINAEHRYELNSLNWRFSFLLRLLK